MTSRHFLLAMKMMLVILLLVITALIVRHFPQTVREDSPSDVVPEMAYLRKYGRVSDLPGNMTQLMNMSLKELIYIYHSYLDNTDFLCHRKLRMGHIGDGGWEVCDDYSYRPVMPCIVYSFGISNDFSFDDEIAKLYGCHVYAFDPSMAVASHNRSSNVHFFKIGLSGKDKNSGGWDMKTFAELRAMLQHQNKTIDIVKMDIESAEWPALTDMLRTGDLLTVRQLLIEFHRMESVLEQYRDRLKQLADLEALGFRRFHTHLNPLAHKVLNEFLVTRSQCYEVYFVNTKFSRSS